MSDHHSGPDLHHVIAATPRSMPGMVRGTSIILVALGLVGLGLGVASDGHRTASAFITNFMYWIGVSQGGFMLAVALMITQGRWGRPLKRIAESFALFVPVLWALLMVFMLVGGLDVYPWMHPDEHPMPPHKAVWLSQGFFFARQFVGLGLLMTLSLLFVRASLRPDLGMAGLEIGDKAPAFWGRLTTEWKGHDAEVASAVKTQMTLAPAIALSYAVVMSFLAVDISMSLAPHWYANMFPAWYFMSSFWSGLVWLAIISLVARDWLGITKLLPPKVYHDLGKLTLGLTMFWGYTTLAQYLAIWYGNMTEEIGFILVRTTLQPWATLSRVVALMCFFVPFALLVNRSLKKIPSAYLAVTGIIAVGIWLERFLVVAPSALPEATTLPIGPVEILMSCGFLGGFLLVVTWFLSKVPPVPLTDPWMQPHPDEVHVHPSERIAHI